MATVRVFLGSSKEALSYARDLEALLLEVGGREIVVKGWWHQGMFPVNTPFFSALIGAVANTNSAILLATPDDKRIVRGKMQSEPRSNITLEYGLFTGAHGAARTALAVIGKPSLPSDVDGLETLRLRRPSRERSFADQNRLATIEWFRGVRTSLEEGGRSVQRTMPRLYEAMMRVLQKQTIPNRVVRTKLDILAAELLESTAATFEADYGFGGMASEITSRRLDDCTGIYALDVIGPSAWVGPSAYRYLAGQIRSYLRTNTREAGFSLSVRAVLGDALARAAAWARERLGSSGMDFVDPDDPFEYTVGEPRLEYARILLWSKEELLSPIGASLIAIHQAFHVPLFFKETAMSDPTRRFDFIAFARRSGTVDGFVNERRRGFMPEPTTGMLPDGRAVSDKFQELLSNSDLAFAIDKRDYWQRRS